MRTIAFFWIQVGTSSGPTHIGSSLGSSTSNSNNAIGTQITTNEGNSPTPPPCPKEGPIPPNCTMTPIIK